MDFPFRCFCIRSVAAASLSQQNEDQECGDQNHGGDDHEGGHTRADTVRTGQKGSKQQFHTRILSPLEVLGGFSPTGSLYRTCFNLSITYS